MKSAQTLWEEICYKYHAGVDSVKWMQKTRNSMERQIDKQRFKEVQMLPAKQLK